MRFGSIILLLASLQWPSRAVLGNGCQDVWALVLGRISQGIAVLKSDPYLKDLKSIEAVGDALQMVQGSAEWEALTWRHLGAKGQDRLDIYKPQFFYDIIDSIKRQNISGQEVIKLLNDLSESRLKGVAIQLTETEKKQAIQEAKDRLLSLPRVFETRSQYKHNGAFAEALFEGIKPFFRRPSQERAQRLRLLLGSKYSQLIDEMELDGPPERATYYFVEKVVRGSDARDIFEKIAAFSMREDSRAPLTAAEKRTLTEQIHKGYQQGLKDLNERAKFEHDGRYEEAIMIAVTPIFRASPEERLRRLREILGPEAKGVTGILPWQSSPTNAAFRFVSHFFGQDQAHAKQVFERTLQFGLNRDLDGNLIGMH